MSDNDNQREQQQSEEQQPQENQQQEGGGDSGESTAKRQTKKIENPDSIPMAGGKQIGEDHKGESKMLAENARSESVAATGDADDVQKQLEGKKVEKKADGGADGEEKQGMVEKAKEKLGLGKKE